MASNLTDGRSIPRKTLEHFRMRAIKLRKEGWEVNEIAASFGFHRGSVSRWLTNYNRRGIKALKRKKAPGAERKLKLHEIKKVLSCIKKPATQFGFESALWDCHRVQQLIREQCNKELHVSNVWRMLKSWKFTPQMPEKRAIEQDDKKVKQWLKEEWPKIKAHARRWQAMLYFQDEAGVSLTAVLGRTWAPKGETPIVRVSGNRGGLCITSAITPVGRMVFRIEKGKVNAGKHIEFLEQIMKRHPNRKIVVIEDQARPHIARKVEKFVEKNKNKFAIYFIPSYSPELNPDEKTWRYLKKHKLKSHTAKSTNELKGLVLSKMKSLQRKPNIIKAFFYGTYVT